MPRVLFVEDDPDIGQLISSWLGRHDIEVLLETRGDLALARVEAEQPDLVILDVMLPGKDGFEVCRAVREKYKGIILMLTARDEDLDQILGLELGADDYLANPVQPRLLLARIKALLRRAPGTASPADQSAESGDGAELSFGTFTISQATRSAHLGSEAIDLTTAEFDLLWLLARHAGSIVIRARALLKHIIMRADNHLAGMRGFQRADHIAVGLIIDLVILILAGNAEQAHLLADPCRYAVQFLRIFKIPVRPITNNLLHIHG